MKKISKMLVVLLLMVFGFILTSCTTNNNSDTVTIKFWIYNGAEIKSLLEEFKDEFVKQYDGKYDVEIVSYGNADTLRKQISQSIKGGVGPTVAQVYPDHVAAYLQGNAVLPLDSFINDPVEGLSKEEQDQFISQFWAEGTVYDKAGTRYSLPFNKSTELMYYNKTLFEAEGWDVPKTWEEVVEISNKWKQTTNYQTAAKTYGEDLLYTLGYDSEANLFITLTQQWGATYTSFDNDNNGVFNAFGENADDTLKSKQALSWFSDAFKEHHVGTSTAFGADYCSTAFQNGQCIMTIGSSAGSSYNDGLTGNANFTTGVSTVPQHSMDNPQVIQQGTNIALFRRNNADEELAGWRWMKFLTSKEIALEWAINTAYFPIRYDVLKSQEFQDHVKGKIVDEQGHEIFEPTLEAIAKAAGLEQQNWFYTNVAFPKSSSARTNAEIIVQNILYGNKTIDTAYADALNSIYND